LSSVICPCDEEGPSSEEWHIAVERIHCKGVFENSSSALHLVIIMIYSTVIKGLNLRLFIYKLNDLPNWYLFEDAS
jgi:hypothetical protein